MASNSDPTVDRVLLPAWDQCGIRAYIQLAFCFPFSDETQDEESKLSSTASSSCSSQPRRQEAEAHVRASLERLSRQCPEFAARLHADEQGRVWLDRRDEYVIPFQVRDETTTTRLGDAYASWSYDELKKRGFPPGAFMHTDFVISGTLESEGFSSSSLSSSSSSAARPVIQVQMSFLEGGMILWVNAHHTLIDGDRSRLFVQCFAAQTRGEEIECPGDVAPAAMRRLEDEDTEITKDADTHADFAELVRKFPEYADLPDRNGPIAVPLSLQNHSSQGEGRGVEKRVERIFVFRHEALKRIGQEIASMPSWKSSSATRRAPSSYLSLAALMWAHITKARVKASESKGRTFDRLTPSKLTTAVDWRKRVFQGTLRGYLGNAVAIPFTELPVGDVIDAASPSAKEGTLIDDKISRLACCIQDTIDSVDEEFVAARTKAMAACKNEPRRFGLGVDPTEPTCLGFNTWRFLSSDADWSIPGVHASRPDAVRRVGAEVGAEKALILPMGMNEGGQYGNIELLVWLTEDALELLLQDEGYMRWVDHVVG